MRTIKPFGPRLPAPTFWLALLCCVIFADGANPLSLSPSAFVDVSQKTSTECLLDSLAYVSALKRGEPWALEMLAASTNPQAAIQSFSVYSMGDFDKCLQAEAPETLGFHGEYCMSSIKVLLDRNVTYTTLKGDHHNLLRATKAATNQVTLSWAFCMPSTCSATDVTELLNQVVNSTIPKNVVANVQSSMCTKSTESSLDGADIAMICILTLFGVMAILSTCYDVYMQRRGVKLNSTSGMLLSSFSLWTNGKKLLFGNKSEGEMASLHGIRFLSMCWVVFGHTFYMVATSPIKNVEYILELPKDWTKMLVLNETVSVDTFFLLSGFLLGYIFFRDREKGSKFNIIAFYLHRYIRLTPPYAIMIGIYATVYAKMGSGPYWELTVGSFRDFCIDSWWTNLLYVNNYVQIEKSCLGQSWYLAVDMQFYWVAPLLLFPLWYLRRYAIYLIPSAVILAVIPPTAITAAEHLPGVMSINGDPDIVIKFFKHVYIGAYARAGPYVVGIGLGYIMNTLRGKEVKIPKAVVALCWALSAACCLAVIFGAFGMIQADYVYNAAEAAIYGGLHRTAWAIGLSWVIFACCHGYAGPVNTFLSWKAMAPLSRLTYTAYLTHFAVIAYNAGVSRTVGFLSPYYVSRDFLGNLAVTLALSAVVSLVFEAPFMTISKVLIKGGGKKGPAAKPQLMYGATGSTKGKVDEEAPSAESEAATDQHLGDEPTSSERGYDNKAFDAVT